MHVFLYERGPASAGKACPFPLPGLTEHLLCDRHHAVHPGYGEGDGQVESVPSQSLPSVGIALKI